MPKYIIKETPIIFGREGDKGSPKRFEVGAKIELSEEEASRIGSNVELIRKAEKGKE